MASFTLTQSPQDARVFLVMGPDGIPVSPVNEFLLHLFHCGRSAYTLRSYARGLAHFFSWLHTTGRSVDEVTPQTIEAYIAFFGAEPKGGACPADPHKVGQINLRTRKSAPPIYRQPRTINHQLSVLASFFAFCIRQDSERGSGHWSQQANPVPANGSARESTHGMPGRDAPRRGKAAELRRRIPRQFPRQMDPALAKQLIDTASSWRDKAILTLLYRTGQRIGDWSACAGRHGILGMTFTDVDERAGTISVLLKGARDEHRVPVTDDFWPLYHLYWLLGTSVRKIANFAFSSYLFTWHVKLDRGKSRDVLLVLPEKQPQAYEKNRCLRGRMRLGKTCQRWARELPQVSSHRAESS